MSLCKFKLGLISATVFLGPISFSALAQTSDSEATRTLSPVTVTATKREEDVQDVAISVTALDADRLGLISADGGDLQYLSARVPSLNVESSFGRIFPRAYIRGLGNTDFDLNASQPVSFVYDEIVYENPLLKGFPVFDVAQVEVLRGPQGTLFGRNTPAGILKFDSVKPDDEFDAYGRASYATYDTIQLEGAVGGPVTDDLSFRISGLYQERADWVDNLATGEDDATGGFEDFAYRAQLLWEPEGTGFSGLINVHGRDLTGGQQIFRANGLSTGSNSLVPGFERDEIFADAQPFSVLDLETQGVTAKAEYDFGGPVLTYVFGWESVEAFSRGDVDGGAGADFLGNSQPGSIPFPSETADGIDDLDQFSHELRLASSGENRFDWTVGLYVFEEDVDISAFSYDTFAGGVQNGFATQTQETTSYAVFGSASYALTERLEVTAGLRYSDDEKDFVAERFQSPVGGGALAAQTVTVGDEDVSWDIALNYAATDTTSVYTRLAKGFRAPSIQGRILFGDAITTADSETLTSLEAGVKSEFLDGRARGSFGVFFYETDNQQLTAIGGAGNFNQLLNADEGFGRGFEAELEALITDELTFTGGVSWNSTEIKDSDLETAPCGAPCTVLDPINPATGGARIDGNSFPNAPEWTANFLLDYRTPLANGEFFATTDWAYKGETNFFLYESVEFTADGYWEGGLRVGFAQGPWTVAAFGRNITDEVGVVGAIDFNNLAIFTNAPRIVGVELRWDY